MYEARKGIVRAQRDTVHRRYTTVSRSRWLMDSPEEGPPARERIVRRSRMDDLGGEEEEQYELEGVGGDVGASEASSPVLASRSQPPCPVSICRRAHLIPKLDLQTESVTPVTMIATQLATLTTSPKTPHLSLLPLGRRMAPPLLADAGGANDHRAPPSSGEAVRERGGGRICSMGGR